MRLNDLQIDGFGVWKGLRVDNLSPNLTVFYGQNEAGKTTLMQFIRSIMFGYSPQRREKYAPPIYGGATGGNAHVLSPQGNYLVQRHVDPNRSNDIQGDLTLTDDADGSLHGMAMLGQLLSEIDESIFTNVFAVGLREIQELNTLNSTDAAEFLYKLTSGLDRVSLVDVMRDINQRRDEIWESQSERKPNLVALQKRRRQLVSEIEELATRSRRWSKVAVNTKEISVRLEELDDELRVTEQQAKVVEIAMQIGDRWRSRKLTDEQLESLGNLPDERDVCIETLDDLNQKIVHQEERIANLHSQRKSVRREALALPINRQLWAQAARVDAMCEHLPWIESLQRQRDRLKGDISSIRQSLGGEVGGLGDKMNVKPANVKDLSDRGLDTLRSNAKKLSAHVQRIDETRDTIERTKLEIDQFHDRVHSAQSSLPGGGVNSREDASRLVMRLRRRIELEQKIDKLNHTRKELERDIDDVVNDQVLPVGKLAVLGVVFILGIVFVGFGLLSFFWTDASAGSSALELGFLFMVLGSVFGLFSFAMKLHWERVAKDELADFRHQFDVVRQQLKRAKTERDEIERHLPSGVGDFDLQLKDAEGQLAQLEDLLPLETRYQTAKAQLAESERILEKQEKEQKELESQWRETLRMVGLPEDLSPHHLNEISKRTERITGFRTRLEQYETELFEREKELGSLTKRIDHLLSEVGMETTGQDTTERLEELRLELGDQRRLMGQRKELSNKFRSLRGTYAKATRELDRLLGQRQRLFAEVGAENEDHFRQFHVKHQQRNELLIQRRNLTEQILAALGNHVTENQVGDELENYGHAGLEKRWEEFQKRIDQLRDQQTQLHQQRGEFMQELKTLAEDSSLDEARLELAALDRKIETLKRQWRNLAVSSLMLDSIREAYEAKRQPETLREASIYLERLTEGHYTRIWTRLVGQELLVDNASSETLSVEHLSRGTREAVYLSLRLALVGAFARRGAVLPMVLDDILVNFDSNRVRAAATVLHEFAESGYQMLMFTCHDHLRDLFHSMGADVRILPHHKDVVDHGAVPMPLGQTPIEEAPVSMPEEPAADVQYIPHSPLTLVTDEFDPELEYELSAITKDGDANAVRNAALHNDPTRGPFSNPGTPFSGPTWDDDWEQSQKSA